MSVSPLPDAPTADVSTRSRGALPIYPVVAYIVLFLSLGVLAYTMETVLAPVVLGLVVGIVLAPISDLWRSYGLPRSSSAVICMFLTLFIAAAFMIAIQPLIRELLMQMPLVWREISEQLDALRAAARSVFETADEINDALTPENSDQAQSAPSESPLPSMQDALVLAPAILAQIVIFAGTLFFFLLTRTEIYIWLSRRLFPLDKESAADGLQSAEQRVARYFGAVTLVNAGLGLSLGTVLHLLGLPNAALWGVAAMLLNYVLYLGPISLMIALLLAGIATFDGLLSFAPMAIFLCLNVLEAQFVTPSVVGSHLKINPLVIFLSLMLGLWLWGPIGGIVAIPLLVWSIELTHLVRSYSTD